MAVGPGEEIGGGRSEEEGERGDEFGFSLDSPFDADPTKGIEFDPSVDPSDFDFSLSDVAEFDPTEIDIEEFTSTLDQEEIEDAFGLDDVLDLAITGLSFVNPFVGIAARVAKAGFTGGAPAARQAAIESGVTLGLGTLLGPVTGKLRGFAGQLGGRVLGTAGAIGGSVLAGKAISQATKGVRQDITQALVEASTVSTPTTTSIARRGEPSLLEDTEDMRISDDNPFVVRRRTFTRSALG